MIARIDPAGSTLNLSRLGFGCTGIHAGIEMRRSARLIEAALAAGIRHFDTAPLYGSGQSEDVLGHVLSGVPDITLTTKVGIARPNSEMAWRDLTGGYRQFARSLLTYMPGLKSRLEKWHALVRDHGPMALAPRRKLRGSDIRRELEESLKRLRRDHVDLYLVHEPDQFDLNDEALETFIAFSREGVVGAFGLGYGRCVTKTPDFGTVIQSRYAKWSPCQDGNKTRIFHGVLRHGWSDRQPKTERALDAGAYIADVLKTNPKVRVVFSASSVHQIEQIAAFLK
jgi:aryl-alcohol dehydrogenase-like predicted oxidoreductase